MMETYAQQRKCRLADVILDYLDDEEVSARRLYEELLAETSEMIDYHQRHAKKYEEFRELIQGHRLIDSFESD
ncbi:hypothetical protein CPTG_00155 [Cyanophage Syn2]|uniref:Uncharacterized protein n=1 Tax=Cyanophage Syn2 TaxID=536473 RepID=M4SNY8_9CAUD|nr:hypothetical protein CPTG_00155 [Cyanophage Syn2]